MPHDIVPTLNSIAGRYIAGVLNMSAFHPVVLCLILAAVAGSAMAVLLDVAADRR